MVLAAQPGPVGPGVLAVAGAAAARGRLHAQRGRQALDHVRRRRGGCLRRHRVAPGPQRAAIGHRQQVQLHLQLAVARPGLAGDYVVQAQAAGRLQRGRLQPGQAPAGRGREHVQAGYAGQAQAQALGQAGRQPGLGAGTVLDLQRQHRQGALHRSGGRSVHRRRWRPGRGPQPRPGQQQGQRQACAKDQAGTGPVRPLRGAGSKDRGGGRRPAVVQRHLGHEAVAAPGHGDDPALVLAQRVAQRGHRLGEGVLLHHPPGPDLGEQLVAPDYAVALAHQHAQHVEDLGGQRHPGAVQAVQLTGARIKDEAAEPASRQLAYQETAGA